MLRGIIALVQFLDLAAKLRRHRRQHSGRAERHAIDNEKCLQVVYRLRPRLTNGGEGDRPELNLGRIAAGSTRWIGRSSERDTVCKYVKISGGAGSLNKKKQN